MCVTDTGTGMSARRHRARVRAVLHDQADRPGHGPRPEPGVRLRQADRRPRQALQRGRRGHDRQDLSAADDRGGCERRSTSAVHLAADRRTPRSRSWSSRTTTTCACSRPRACASSDSRCCEANDGPSALKQLEQHPEVQLLFTDVGLPGMNGAQLVAAARALRPDIKVLFTTGYARNAIVHQGRLDPGVELITKPFTRVQLATRIRDVLDVPVGGLRKPTALVIEDEALVRMFIVDQLQDLGFEVIDAGSCRRRTARGAQPSATRRRDRRSRPAGSRWDGGGRGTAHAAAVTTRDRRQRLRRSCRTTRACAMTRTSASCRSRTTSTL